MTDDEALKRTRERWNHPALDRHDVDERIALRIVDRENAPTFKTVACPPAVRVFLQKPSGWTSSYVHSTHEVDAAIDELEQRARTAR